MCVVFEQGGSATSPKCKWIVSDCVVSHLNFKDIAECTASTPSLWLLQFALNIVAYPNKAVAAHAQEVSVPS